MSEDKTTPSDRQFLETVKGYAEILTGEQEARLSRLELERMILLARMGRK